MDTENKGNGIVGLIMRVFYAGVGVVYAGLAGSAVRFLINAGSLTPGDKPEREIAERSFKAASFGRWLVAIVGAGFIVFCFYELRRAFVRTFEVVKTEGAKQTKDVVATRIGQVGITARGVVFALIGCFLIQSA